jgi:putative ABC transport system permease protein
VYQYSARASCGLGASRPRSAAASPLAAAANALHGHTFTAEDDLPNGTKTVVLAYAFWQRRFGSDPQVIGRRMTLSGERYEIIGVWAPISQMELDPHSTEQGHYFNVAGRLKPGVTLAAANARLQASYLTGYLRFGSIGDS